jgi:endonuclease YncB( thermonuclease family)
MTSLSRFRISFYLALFAALPCFAGKDKTYGDVVVAEIIDVYDGDTFKANIKGWPSIIGDTISIRIAGVDTPEKRGGDAYTKDRAEKARKYSENRLRTAKVVTLKNMRRGKYFRIVADVYVDRWSLAKELIRVGLGKEYHGGRRPTW